MSILKRLFYQWMYLQKPPWDTGISPPELVSFIETHPPGRALDLGCGTGTNAIALAKAGWNATGVDFVGKAIHKAREKARKAGVAVDFHVGDVTRLEGIDGKFDLILDIGCFHGLSEEGKVAYTRRVMELLKEGGHYLLYGFLKDTQDEGRGISPEDISRMEEGLRVTRRETGHDRGEQRSGWFWFSS